MSRYQRLLGYVLPEWPSLLGILLLTAASSAVAALQPWPLKLLLDYALGGARVPDRALAMLEQLGIPPAPMALVVAAAVASLLIFLVSSAVQAGLTWAWAFAGHRMVLNLAADLFRRLLRLSVLFHARQPVGDSLERLSADAWCVYKLVDGPLVSPTQQVVTFVTIGTIAWQLDPVLAALTLTSGPLLASLSWYFGPKLKRRARVSREAQARLAGFTHTTLFALPVVRTFGAEERHLERFRSLASEAVAASQRASLIRSAYSFTTGFVIALGTALVLYVGSFRVLAGTLTVGSLLVFVSYMRSLQSASRQLLGTYASLKSVEASVDRVIEVLDSDHEVVETSGARDLCSPGQRVAGRITFENVSFGYEPGRPTLQEVSFTARAGETIALVGPTGAGKTTLASLIPRLFDPWKGRILIDGHDVRDVTLSSLRAQVGIVLQEPLLLPLSVSENIAYGRRDATPGEIVEAARAAGADGFIRALPDGYATVLGERGATLSGGERQRLTLARAFLKAAPILVLDEPTSALDAQAERQLVEVLDRLKAGRTTFIIAHRLSTIERADRILVLEQGRIVEDGVPADLLSRPGSYARLYRLQLSLERSGAVA